MSVKLSKCSEKTYCVLELSKVSRIRHWTTSDGEALDLAPWGAWDPPSFTLLPGPLWAGVTVYVRVSSIDQIDLFKNGLYYIGP